MSKQVWRREEKAPAPASKSGHLSKTERAFKGAEEFMAGGLQSEKVSLQAEEL